MHTRNTTIAEVVVVVTCRQVASFRRRRNFGSISDPPCRRWWCCRCSSSWYLNKILWKFGPQIENNDVIWVKERVLNQIFMDSFEASLSISIEEVSDAMTAFTKLSVVNGRIPLQPGVKCRVTAFIQWARSMLRTGRDPTLMTFPVGDVISLMQDLQTCKKFKS